MGGMLGVENELKNMEAIKNMIIEDTEFTNYIYVLSNYWSRYNFIKKTNDVTEWLFLYSNYIYIHILLVGVII